MRAARAARPLIAPVLLLGLHLASAPLVLPALTAGSAPVGQVSGARPWITLPKAAEHTYRIKAKVRLLLFWVGKDNVGDARLAWYQGAGTDRGYECLIGSDPARAPRRINRWGYVAEEHRGGVSSTFGVMKPTEETSLEEAKANTEKSAGTGIVFAMLRETATGGEAVSELTKARFDRDYSFRELDLLLEEFAKAANAPEVKRARFEPDVTPGLLSAIATMMHDDAEARRSARGSRGAQGRVVRYGYNAKTYNLTLASSQFLGRKEYNGRVYTNLVENEFDITMRGFTWKEKFTVVYDLSGSEAEVPVFAVYQPRWWFKAELTLDDSQGQ